MKSMKKILALCLVVATAVVVTSCGKNATPSDAVEAELKGIQTEEIKDLKKSMPNSLDSSYDKQWGDFLKKIQDFDYKVKDEKVSGKKATVTVTITTYDFGQAYQSTYDQIVNDAKSGSLTSSTDVTKYTYDLLFKNILGVKNKKYTKDVVINCKKNDDGEWTTDAQTNQNLLNALMGGMVEKIAAISGQQ